MLESPTRGLALYQRVLGRALVLSQSARWLSLLFVWFREIIIREGGGRGSAMVIVIRTGEKVFSFRDYGAHSWRLLSEVESEAKDAINVNFDSFGVSWAPSVDKLLNQIREAIQKDGSLTSEATARIGARLKLITSRRVHPDQKMKVLN